MLRPQKLKILKSRITAAIYIRYHVGSSNSAFKFWLDPWVQNLPLVSEFPEHVIGTANSQNGSYLWFSSWWSEVATSVKWYCYFGASTEDSMYSIFCCWSCDLVCYSFSLFDHHLELDSSDLQFMYSTF